MALMRMPKLLTNFKNIEVAFIFLIAMKLCFNGLAMMEDFKPADGSALSLSHLPNAFAQSEAKKLETSPVPGEQRPSPIDMKILETIKKRSEELDARDAALNQREGELKMLEATIEQKLQKMTATQKKIEKLLSARDDLIDRSVKHLMKVYSSMKPAEAAKLIEKLDKDISIQILSKMKGKNAAKILEKMDPGIATDLSDKIAKRK